MARSERFHPEKLRAAARADRLADHVTCNPRTGEVRWKGHPISGPFLFKIRKWPDKNPKYLWHAQAYRLIVISGGRLIPYAYQALAEHLARHCPTRSAAIRAGLLELAERGEAQR